MRQLEERKQIIRDGVISQMKTIPIYKLKVAPLVKKLGISRAAFYELYGSVFDVVEEIENEVLPNRHLNVTSLDNKEEATHRMSEAVRGMLGHLEAFKVLTGPNGDQAFTYRYIKRIQDFIYSLAIAEGDAEDRAQLIARSAAHGYIATLVSLVQSDMFTEKTAERYTQMMVNDMLRSLKRYHEYFDI